MSLQSLTSKHSVTHRRKSYARGAGGGRVLTNTTVGTKTCRIQPLNAEDRDQLKQDGMDVSMVAYFSSDPSIQENDELVFGSRVLQVKGVINFDELDRLWKAYLREMTDEEG